MITLEQAVEAVKAAVERKPNELNPRIEDIDVCVFTDADDPSRHCIAGQALVDLGLEVLPPGDLGSMAALPHQTRKALTPEAFRFLSAAQGVFDVATKNGRPWSEAFDILKDRVEYAEVLS